MSPAAPGAGLSISAKDRAAGEIPLKKISRQDPLRSLPYMRVFVCVCVSKTNGCDGRGPAEGARSPDGKCLSDLSPSAFITVAAIDAAGLAASPAECKGAAARTRAALPSELPLTPAIVNIFQYLKRIWNHKHIVICSSAFQLSYHCPWYSLGRMDPAQSNTMRLRDGLDGICN